MCTGFHTEQRCFARLSNAWRAKFPDVPEFPNWADLLRRDVPIFDLYYEAILAAMYALSVSAEGDCYLCVPPDPGIAPGSACEAPLGTAPAQALHTFTLDSGASRCFFRDSTTVTPLPAPVPVSLADPSGGPVLARSSTVLPCPAVPSGELSGLHLPSFSTNLVSHAVLQDAGVDTFTPGRQRVAICTCSQSGRHLATFARAPGSCLYTLTTASCSAPLSPQCHASTQHALPLPGFWSSQVSASPTSLACAALHSLRRKAFLGDSGPAGSGAVPGGAELGGAESGGAEREEPGGAASGGAEPACAEPGGAESGGESPEGSETTFPRSSWNSRLRPRVPLTSQQLHDWYGRRQRRASSPQGSTAGGPSAGVAGPGGARTEGTGAAGAGGVVTEGTGAAEGAGAAGGTGAAGGAGGAGAAEGTGATSGAGAAEAGGAGGAEAAGGAGAARGAGAAGAGGTAQQRLFFAPPSLSSQPPPDSALRQVLSLPSSTGLPLQPGSPLPAPSPYIEQTGGLAERREPASRPVSPVRSGRSGRRVPRQRQLAVSGSHLVVRRPSSPPLRVPLPSPPASSLPVVANPASDQFHAAHTTVMRLLATVVTDPSFESAAASALVAELVDFAAACCLDYAASLVVESESVCPPSVGGECALGTDVLEDKQEDLECLAAAALSNIIYVVLV
ncbi:unnamed protein product [Closterium sp. NIES-54]